MTLRAMSSRTESQRSPDRAPRWLSVIFPCAVLLLVIALTILSLQHVRGEPVKESAGTEMVSSGSQATELLLDWTRGVTAVSDDELAVLRDAPDLGSVPTVQRLLARGERELVYAAVRSPRAREGFQAQAPILLSGDDDPRVREIARTLIESPRSHPKVRSVCRAILDVGQDETERKD